MKKIRLKLAVIAVFLCAIVCASLSGCETAKGIGRDFKAADKWLKEKLW